MFINLIYKFNLIYMINFNDDFKNQKTFSYNFLNGNRNQNSISDIKLFNRI
jgi:hypothetical protein